MDVLKRIKGSTLMETLVASVMIVIVFMIASMILNNTFTNSIKNNTHFIDNRIHELRYLEMNDALIFPYEETINDWEINVERIEKNESVIVEIEARNLTSDKTVNKTYFEI